MGLIDTQQQPPQPANAGFSSPAQPAAPDGAAASREKLFKVQKIVLAAQKVMYSEKTGAEFRKMLQGDDVVQTAAKAATSVMLILISESKLQIDPQLIIPAGVVVVGDVLDFIEQAQGIKHDENQVEESVELFIKQIMQAVSPEQPQEPAQPVQGAMQ